MFDKMSPIRNFRFFRLIGKKLYAILQRLRDEAEMLSREKGVTLVELLIVIAVIGLLSAVAVPVLLAYIPRAKNNKTKAHLKVLGTEIGYYQIDHNQVPSTNNSLPEKLSNYTSVFGDRAHLKDGWKNTFFYVSDGSSYCVCSWGKDEIIDTFALPSCIDVPLDALGNKGACDLCMEDGTLSRSCGLLPIAAP